MKPLTILVMLLCCSVVFACDYCIEHPGEKEIQNSGIGANNGTEQLQRCNLVLVRRINSIDKEIKDIKDTLSKIYSMLADLHIKEMGQERYNQIYDPTNEGEVAKQKRHDKEEAQKLADKINSYIKSGKQIEVVVK